MTRRPRHQCFTVDGAVVLGDPDMPPEAMAVLRELIVHVKRTRCCDWDGQWHWQDCANGWIPQETA